ncbi:LytTR family transcriptional regulator DNA-binding domain-containing protein [Spongiimicrobium salis]|uniref:LytTR family transcriptional regulator DNA-binding domain-containing protein n=1 Tax=Spongiimicrobium salis TaxID=1667022 RepID=UPI00374DD459
MKLLTWLNKPYPLINGTKDKVLLVFSFGLFVAVFLFIFKPFGLQKITDYQLPFILGFGLSVTLALGFCYFIIPNVFRSLFNAERWQIKKEIGFLFLCFIVVAGFNTFYNNTFYPPMGQERDFLEFFGISFSVGIFPVIILIFLVELISNKKNNTNAIALNKLLSDKEPLKVHEQITITADSIKEKPLKMALDSFLYATSANNYTTLTCYQDSKIVHQLVRLSLKKLENQLQDYPSILRVHRSYIVNTSKIITVKGNARALYLLLEGAPNPIPVSRNFPRKLLI